MIPALPRRAALLGIAAALPARAQSPDAVAVTRGFYADFDARPHDPSRYARHLAPDFRDRNRPAGAPASLSDRAANLWLLDAVVRGFPDAVHRLEFVEPIGEDRAVVYWTFEGTQTGMLFGAPASGRRAVFNGIDIFRVAGGLIREHWHVEDLYGMFQ
jgi:predicted ester cyclase